MGRSVPITKGAGAMKPQEVADLLRAHVDTVKAIPPHMLPFFRINARGDRRYERSAVMAFIKSQTERE